MLPCQTFGKYGSLPGVLVRSFWRFRLCVSGVTFFDITPGQHGSPCFGCYYRLQIPHSQGMRPKIGKGYGLCNDEVSGPSCLVTLQDAPNAQKRIFNFPASRFAVSVEEPKLHATSSVDARKLARQQPQESRIALFPKGHSFAEFDYMKFLKGLKILVVTGRTCHISIAWTVRYVKSMANAS